MLPIYGGVAYEPQVDTLKKGVEILVGTPGRLLDLAKQKQLKLDSIKALVLDEADRMLDLGFLEDVEKILAMLPERAADDALLGHHAGPDRRAVPPVPAPPGDHPRRAHRRERPVAADQAGRLPHPPAEQAGDGGPHPAGPRAAA